VWTSCGPHYDTLRSPPRTLSGFGEASREFLDDRIDRPWWDKALAPARA